jgi:cytoskeleton protein RodZ
MPDIHHGNPGKILASHRETMGWSVEQVADQLKLAVRQVVALEAGDFAALPSAAVTRGFVRAYAKILKLDAAPLVAMIEMDTAPMAESASVRRDSKPARFSETSRFPMHSKRSSLPVGWIVGGVVVAVAAAAAWHFGLLPQREAEPAAQGAAGHSTELPVPASVPGAASEPLQNPNVPLISVPAQNDGAAPSAAPGASAPATPGAAAPAAPAAGAAAPAAGTPAAAVQGAPVPAQAVPAPAQPVQAATATAVGPNALVFNVREDAWIQVKTASGKTLISRLVKGGSTETLELDEPATVVVGNAGAVNATLRGAAVQLPLLPGKTVSRVSLK